ncbi:hypothetical protein K469DRAFT_71130 [Zopfia rhizophila CBS 207.26]|uniref:Uncharacterized protein n=1 Tax=Zopfia rhizophila CBS 207.26 TaxID=1314779 RepID=A0A6A6EC72_9PEZI|nr:hypothetical protein K469DRAFT_71130 [Zopfia rhizophila CBS 207.26]
MYALPALGAARPFRREDWIFVLRNENRLFEDGDWLWDLDFAGAFKSLDAFRKRSGFQSVSFGTVVGSYTALRIVGSSSTEVAITGTLRSRSFSATISQRKLRWAFRANLFTFCAFLWFGCWMNDIIWRYNNRRLLVCLSVCQQIGVS